MGANSAQNGLDVEGRDQLDSTLPLSILDEHEETRKELAKIKFGNPRMIPCPATIAVPNPEVVLDFLPETMASMPYRMEVFDLPLYSRVETQIKLKLKFSPAPSELLLHVPQDLISKNKFGLVKLVEKLPLSLRKNMLFLDTFVMTSDLLQSCRMCPRCIKRERKRALRLKGRDSHNKEEQGMNAESSQLITLGSSFQNPWEDEKMLKKAIIYNCKEILSFLPPSGLPTDQSKLLDFSARIICYCRHHKESEGFKLLMVVRDYMGNIKAKCVSSPIMIMDRKKSLSVGSRSTLANPNPISHLSALGSAVNAGHHLASLHPLLPNSIDDLTSDSAVRGIKRKKMSLDDLYNLFLPVSNSDTNASVHHSATAMGKLNPNTLVMTPSHLPRASLYQQMFNNILLTQQGNGGDIAPCIQKIIPAQGPCRGGIEVTLLGYNFHPGLIVKFGAKNALATHCWSESTIVTYLPPCAQPGQVLVSFENEVPSETVLTVERLHMVFTYTDDTDRQLIELALQIVGLKMNGKLEDAKNIAKRIVGSDKAQDNEARETMEDKSSNGEEIGGPSKKSEHHQIWYDNAHRAVQTLSRSSLSTEEILINFLSLVDLSNCPIIIPNWNLANAQGQTPMHLACLKNYGRLVGFLILHGTKINAKDNQGLTPFFLASMGGYRKLMKLLLNYRSPWNVKLSNDKYLKDYCDLNVLDVFESLEENAQRGNEAKVDVSSTSSVNGHYFSVDEPLNRSVSFDSLNSINMDSYGRHVLRIITESFSDDRDKGFDFLHVASETLDSEMYSGSVSASKSSRVTSPDSPRISAAAFGNESDGFADSELDSEEDMCAGQLSESDYADYANDYDDDSGNEFEYDENRIGELQLRHPSNDQMGDVRPPNHGQCGLWNKMKRAVFALTPDTTATLPSYDDLFPLGGNGEERPKLEMERALNQQAVHGVVHANISGLHLDVSTSIDEAGNTLDLSEDIALSYINRPHKTVRNDKMLLFFWIPTLILLVSLYIYVSLTGYKVQVIEHFKTKARNTLGNVMFGNERLAQVFRT
ncbi:hypothetical protein METBISCDRAFT_11135 [Metschnikowia bicuspidata]|uniref:IPT/TIG domain-containing protein n=1 Tax=Metschnikowia bicuspidata TaxID=27322 RepID=A0A4P9ZIU8_9ASCO|nr:hypothetical protein METBISCDRAFT_11135 [Metschnikowia bicuspidata]